MSNEATLIGFRLIIDENGDLVVETTTTPYEALECLTYEERLYVSAAMSGAQRAVDNAINNMKLEVSEV